MPAVPPRRRPRDLVARAPQTADTSVLTTTSTGGVTTKTSIASTPISTSADGQTSFTGTPTQLAESSAAPSTSSSSTSDQPFFPDPTTIPPPPPPPEEDPSLQHTKSAVEGALVAVAAAIVIALVVWRIVRLRRSGQPLSEFFRAHPQPDVPPRPREVPRTTGLPHGPAPPVSVIYDTLPTPAPLLYRGDIFPYERRRRGRRTHAGDVDSRGRRGNIAHPDDPEEFLPEYDDKDILPRYQDLHRSSAGRTGAGASGLVEGRSPNGVGEAGDTIPLVTRMQLSSTVTLDDGNPQGVSSAGSHEGHETHLGHGETHSAQQHTR